jgi:hypothetical protein
MKRLLKWFTSPMLTLAIFSLLGFGAGAEFLGLIHSASHDYPFVLAVVFGTGIMPASGAIATELTYITRRAFVPKMVVQIYNNSPTMASVLANSQPAYGGVSSISVPVQGAPFVTGNWAGYDGSFNQPSDQQGAFLFEANLKLFIVPIPFLGMEGVLQLDHAVIPKIEAKMNDATNTTMDTFSTALFGNTTNQQAIIGFPGAIDDGTNMVTYGNINRNTNVWWQSKVYAAGGINPTRQSLLQFIAGTAKNGGEKPTFGVCGFGTWALLAQDYQGQEQFVITPGSGFDGGGDGPRSGFDALMVCGVPVYADQYCPEGTVYLINSNYVNLYVHVLASFQFTGFESTISNWQLGYVGCLVCILELANVKPKANTRIGGYNFLTL